MRKLRKMMREKKVDEKRNDADEKVIKRAKLEKVIREQHNSEVDKKKKTKNLLATRMQQVKLLIKKVARSAFAFLC